MEQITQEINKAEIMLDEFISNRASQEAIRDITYYIKGLKMAYKVLEGKSYVYSR